ncbi:hypothetical protein LOTGIDRAFT_121326, partial [Lottia gigantea]
MVEDIRVVMFGKTGVGKSLLGNNILDHAKFPNLGCTQSVTIDNNRGERVMSKYRKLVLVDTPGLHQRRTTFESSCYFCMEPIKLTKPGPHIFMFVLSIGRFTQEECETIEFLKNIFGSHVTDFLIIVFTGKDTLDYDKMDLEMYINTAGDELKSLVSQCQGRIAINNRAAREEVTKSVDSLLQMITGVHSKNKKKHYTDKM